MLPDEVLSTEIIEAPFQGATALPITQYIDYEDGGIAIQDPSEGLLYQVWRARIVNNPSTGNDEIYIGAEEVEETLFLAATSITEVSLAFDRNMNLNVAYVQGGDAKLYWYDSALPGYTTTDYGTTITTPRITHDDKRPLQTNQSDVILGYLKDGDLCYRQQRDRYDTEYVLQEDVESTGLIKLGLNKSLRLQFLLKI